MKNNGSQQQKQKKTTPSNLSTQQLKSYYTQNGHNPVQDLKNSNQYITNSPLKNSPLYRKTLGLTNNMRQTINATTANGTKVGEQVQASSRKDKSIERSKDRKSRSGPRKSNASANQQHRKKPTTVEVISPKEKYNKTAMSYKKIDTYKNLNVENFDDDEDDISHQRLSQNGHIQQNPSQMKINEASANEINIKRNDRQSYHFATTQDQNQKRQTHDQVSNSKKMNKYLGTNEKPKKNQKIPGL